MDYAYHFKRAGRAAVFAALCLACGLSVPARAAGGSAEAVRGFKSEVSLAMATTAALAEARRAAVEEAVRDLALQNEIRLFLSGKVLRDAPRPDPLALAWAMLEGEESASSVSGTPPDMRVRVRASLRLRLEAGAEGAAFLARLLSRSELLDLYARALRLQDEALRGYDAASLPFLRPGALSPAGGKEPAEAARRLAGAYNALEASLDYLALLPGLHPPEGGRPPAGDGGLLPLLERLAGQAPGHYLLGAELARLRLLDGSALQAREMLDAIVAAQPDFAQAYDWRGLCLLWLELPSLALADFNRAIALEPYHPEFFENRALTQRILENVSAMCADLDESCRLGECAGSEWAAAQGLCTH